jgi:hypothetical protein
MFFLWAWHASKSCQKDFAIFTVEDTVSFDKGLNFSQADLPYPYGIELRPGTVGTGSRSGEENTGKRSGHGGEAQS